MRSVKKTRYRRVDAAGPRACALSQFRFAFQKARFGQTSEFSRRELRPSLDRTLDHRGRGERRVPLHPQPRVRNKKAHELVTTGTQGRPALPHAMVLTAYSVLSPVTGLSCHRRRRNTFRQLDASVGASGPHGFAVRSSRLRQEASPGLEPAEASAKAVKSRARLALPSRPPHPVPRP